MGVYEHFIRKMVRIKRLELPRLSAPDPKSGVSTNFTISAHKIYLRSPASTYSRVVRPTRFERVTYALEGRCSIQLS